MKFFAYTALIASASAAWFPSAGHSELLQASLAVNAEMPLDEVFDHIDTNKDGALDMDEIMHVIDKYCTAENHCSPPTRDEVQHYFDMVDTNGDGKVTPHEIKMAIWNAVDTDGNGKWSLPEVE